MTTLTYFAQDGSYGSNDCVILITDNWTAEDWREVEDCADYERLSIALSISRKHEAQS